MRLIAVVVLATAMLVPLAGARAAAPAPIDAQNTEVAATPQSEAPAAAPQGQDNALNIIVIQSGDEQFIPNPFKNPSPRMISDAWAQRT